MDPIIHQFVNIPDDPIPACERSLSLPPMDDDVDSLRAIPEPDGECEDRANVLILRTDVDGQALPLGWSDDGAKHLKRVRSGIEFFPQFTSRDTWSDFDLVPDLTPDSSPASVSSSTLLTPETGRLCTEVETPPLMETHFEGTVFGDNDADYVSSYLDELEDSLSRDAACYTFPHTMLEDIACQPSTLLVHSTGAISPCMPTPGPIPESKNSDAPTLGSLSGNRSFALGSAQCSPRSPDRRVDQRLFVAVTPSPTPHPPSLGKGDEEEDLTSLIGTPEVERYTPLLSPTSPSLLGKRCRLPLPGDGAPVEGPSRRSKVTSDDDDEYAPPTRQTRHKEARPPSTLSGDRLPPVRPNTGAKTKRRASKKARSYMSSSSTPRSRCQHCKSTFSRVGDVDRHQKSLACPVLRRKAETDGTLDEAKFSCPICGDKLSRNDSQARHFDNTHPGFDPAKYGLKLRKRDGRLC